RREARSKSTRSTRAISGRFEVSSLAEHLRLESKQLRGVLPRIVRQSGFAAGLGEKRVGVPLPLGRGLRQQKTPMPALLDEQTMAADLDLPRRCDRLEQPEQRDLDLQVGQLGLRDRWKPRVAAARRDGAPRDDEPERLVRLNVADAPAQIAAAVQRHERAAKAIADCGLRAADGGFRVVGPHDVRRDGLARQSQQERAIDVARHDAPKLPSAAARYPTTADLSPDTSPESA